MIKIHVLFLAGGSSTFSSKNFHICDIYDNLRNANADDTTLQTFRFA